MSDILILLKDASKMVGLAETTVKSYMNRVEKFCSYRMQRSNDGKLIFSDIDIELLKTINQLKKIKGMTVDGAIKQAISDVLDLPDKSDESDQSDISVTGLSNISDIKNTLSVVSDMSAKLDEVLNQNKDMSDKLNEVVSHNKELTNEIEAIKVGQLRESMETKKLLIEVKDMLMAQQETAANKESEKKGFWARLFGR